jgi:hypothetical protein
MRCQIQIAVGGLAGKGPEKDAIATRVPPHFALRYSLL